MCVCGCWRVESQNTRQSKEEAEKAQEKREKECPARGDPGVMLK